LFEQRIINNVLEGNLAPCRGLQLGLLQQIP